MSAPAPASLPRDILRWIQSLDLSYSVKNAKRDFANGFLVAELFSRYYEQDVQMHSYSNNHSLDNKRDNWNQLMKFFRKRGVQPDGKDVTQEEVNDIMQAKAGAINTFLAKVYSFLTGKKVHAATVRPVDELPAFAKSTAAHAIRETMRDPGVEAISDISTKEARMREALQQHQVALAEEKVKDPSRYAPTKRGAKVVRGATRAVGQEESVGSVEIKQVAVKSVDASVANLRAAKELQATRSTLSLGGASALPDLEASGLQPVMEVLNQAVKGIWTDKCISEPLDASLGPVLSLVDKVVASGSTFPPAIAADVIRGLNKPPTVSSCVDACVASPKEFYQLFTLFQPILSAVAETLPVFTAVVDLLVTAGKLITQKDAGLCARMFRDFALPSLCPLIEARPTKRHAALRLLYACAAPTSAGHLQAVRVLQQALNNLKVFSHCLSILIFIEDAFSEDLLDLYLYYCMIGMRDSSPALRAASIAMLSPVASQNLDLVAGIVDQLVTLKSDTWWEVKAQLLIVSATLLELLDPEGDAETVAAVNGIVISQLDPASPPAVLRVGVAYLGKCLARHGGALSDAYVKALLKVPADARQRLLDASGPPDELPMTGLSGGKYRLPCPATEWPADILLAALVHHVQVDRLEHLDVEHYQVVNALVSSTSGASDRAVTAAYEALQSYLFVGLCDPECSASAVTLLTQLVDGCVGARVFSASSLLGALVLLHRFPGGTPDPQCQSNVATFFTDISNRSASLKAAITTVLTQFKASNGDLLKSSPLGPVARSLGL